MAALDIPTLRSLLAQFLPDQRLIRAFEQWGEITDSNAEAVEAALASAAEALIAAVMLQVVAQQAVAPDPVFVLPDGATIPDAAMLAISPGTLRAGSGLTGGGDMGRNIDLGLAVPTASGVYTPTLTNVANVAASTPLACQYLRVGDVVTVTGAIDVTASVVATPTQIGVSLPIASALAGVSECAGTVAAGDVTQAGSVSGDTTNDRAQIDYFANAITSHRMFFTFSYRIL